MLKLDLMAIFALVAECGSFTAAAAKLGLPKSTVSQRVAELEEQVGLRLLQRTTRKLSLTEAGRVYLGHCQAMMEEMHAADAALSALRDAPSGELRLTAPEASAHRLLPPMLAAFSDAYPQVALQLIVSDQHLDLVSERIDLAFRTGRLEDSSFVSRKLGRVKRVLVAAPDYLDRLGRPDVLSSLAQHHCLVHQSAPHWLFEEGNAEQSITPMPALRSNSLVYLLQMALLGRGIAMLPAFMCAEELASGRLERVLPGERLVPNAYYAIYPSRSHLPAALSAMLEFVRKWDLARLIEPGEWHS